MANSKWGKPGCPGGRKIRSGGRGRGLGRGKGKGPISPKPYWKKGSIKLDKRFCVG